MPHRNIWSPGSRRGHWRPVFTRFRKHRVVADSTLYALMEPLSHYDQWFNKLTAQGTSAQDAVVVILHRYLDGKSGTAVSANERDTALWSSTLWKNCPDDVFHTESFALAFAKYLGRDNEQRFAEIARALTAAPEACKRAIRYSKVFLTTESARWRELQRLLDGPIRGYRKFLRECRGLWRRYERLRRDADEAYGQFSDLSILDLLVYASISAFKTELPPVFGLAPPNPVVPHPQFRYPLFTEAVSRLLARRLEHCDEDELKISEDRIRVCFKKRMYPLLLARHDDGGVSAAAMKRFERFIDAQIRLDGFRQREICNFCFDSIGASRGRIDTLDDSLRPTACFEPWVRSQVRGQALRQYWEARGLVQLSEIAAAQGETLDTLEQEGRLAPMTGALTHLAMLRDLFGMEDLIDLGNDIKVSLLQACLAIESAKANYEATLSLPFLKAMRRNGDWAPALTEVIDSGIFDGLQQRYPVLFARTEEKLQILRQFTVADENPSGTDKAAAALLEFWGNDLTPVRDPIHRSGRQLKGSFAEQPFVKLGDYVFTLPWVLTTQDNATALVNNLRRVRSGRPDVGEETQRVEHRLAEQMQRQGFRTLVGHMPADGEGEPPGEIDLLATRDGHLFLFEIKSGFVRQTLEGAWHHRTSTLRKAGRQLRRKLAFVRGATAEAGELRDELQIEAIPPTEQVHAWIVDTSVDFDRERFSGHLKVSMTEVLIALRDEAALLGDDSAIAALYPEGFSAWRFAQVIEEAALWAAFPRSSKS